MCCCFIFCRHRRHRHRLASVLVGATVVCRLLLLRHLLNLVFEQDSENLKDFHQQREAVRLVAAPLPLLLLFLRPALLVLPPRPQQPQPFAQEFGPLLLLPALLFAHQSMAAVLACLLGLVSVLLLHYRAPLLRLLRFLCYRQRYTVFLISLG
jgi:hypothetical protein